MNMIEKLTEWMKNRRKHTMARRRALCDEHAKELIQVREFEGVVWFAYNDIPLLTVNDFKGSIADTLDAARQAYSDYMMTKF